jgi:hypothetical protein
MQLVGSIFMVQVQEMQRNRYLLYVVSEVLEHITWLRLSLFLHLFLTIKQLLKYRRI